MRGQAGTVAPGIAEGTLQDDTTTSPARFSDGLAVGKAHTFTVFPVDAAGAVVGTPASVAVGAVVAKDLRFDGRLVREGSTTRLYGTLVDLTGAPVPGYRFRVAEVNGSNSFDDGVDHVTDSQGRFVAKTRAAAGDRALVWAQRGTVTDLPVRAMSPRMKVLPDLLGGFSQVFVSRGGRQPFRIDGPAGLRGARVVLQQRVSGSWRAVGRTRLDARGDGAVAARAQRKGNNCFRARVAARGYYGASVTSTYCFVGR